MGQILDSDWSRQNLLRSDWSGPRVALITTFHVYVYSASVCLVGKFFEVKLFTALLHFKKRRNKIVVVVHVF